VIGDRIARPGHGHHDGVFHHRDTHIEVGSSASDEKPRLKWIHLEFPNLGCSSVVVRRKHRSALRENALQALAARDVRIGDYNEVVFGAVPLQSWRSYTLKLFANWIGAIAAEKPRRRTPRPAAKSA